jgi:serine/threonine protein kinase/tetratricopeptide (TPR) repeat protein
VADLREQLQGGLADRYRLERELGRGGMATVFLAHDLRHDRPVALKVLHPELAATVGPERFLREIKLAARLQHPHVLTVHDSGETAGQLWYIMPYVEGESLRDRLNREKQLPIEDALQITREVADALGYAHSQGVVHRDIKPENILMSHGHALVADFGLARAIQAADNEKLTETGISLGTPAYMSPEQSTADPIIDGRSDLYSLGCVLYEMLTGEPPYTGRSAQAIIAKRLTEAPRSLRSGRETVPDSVERAVVRALAKAPADRFQSAAEFARALLPEHEPQQAATTPFPVTPHRPGRVAAPAFALGLLLMASMGLYLWQDRRHKPEGTEAGLKRVAVLPFENQGPPEQVYFAEGITDEIRGKLATLPALQVTARSSSTPYRDTRKSAKQIGRELGVEYLLTATVRWDTSGENSRVRVSPELVQVATASTKWQQSFEAPLTDMFRVQADISTQVAQALNVALGADQRRSLSHAPTPNLDAYRAYLRGEAVSNAMTASDPLTVRQAIIHYEQAVALDSTFIPAWARLSQAHSIIYYIIEGTLEERELARAAAERAITLGPERPEGRLALGAYHYRVSGDCAQALEQYQLGQRVTPRSAELLVGIGLAEQCLGRWEASLEHLQVAQVLDPQSPGPIERLARTFLWLRRYPEALAAADRGLALAAADLSLIGDKAMVYLAQGNLAQARAVYQAASNAVDLAALVADVGNYWDLFWVLDDAQQAILLRLTPALFAGNRGAWGLTLAGTYALKGNRVKARAYADSARAFFEAQLRANPENVGFYPLIGVALAYSGRKADAIRSGERGLALQPVTKDAYSGAYHQHQLARIYILVGEPEKALDQLEPLLKVPYFLSPAWLRIDPTFDPLRGNPRFERLVNGS